MKRKNVKNLLQVLGVGVHSDTNTVGIPRSPSFEKIKTILRIQYEKLALSKVLTNWTSAANP
jgi:hypothetical protein